MQIIAEWTDNAAGDCGIFAGDTAGVARLARTVNENEAIIAAGTIFV